MPENFQEKPKAPSPEQQPQPIVEIRESYEQAVSPMEREGIEVDKELRREIEMMKLDEATKQEAAKGVQRLEFLGQKEKIEHLLKIAHEKGVLTAVQMAKEMNDPYLLDVFHDLMAKEGFYKSFLKKSDDDD
jgi:DUF1009 family protein